MLNSPPRGTQWLSWLYVVIWSLIIFLTIPFARAIQGFVYQQWNRDIFTYGVLSAILIAFAALTVHVIRYRSISRSGFLWISTVAAIFIVYTVKLGDKSPEEAIHFVQYGVLGILVYRALTHRVQDISVYFMAATVCGIIGMLDEVIQWLTPQRVWGLRDVWLNFFAACLLQISIAMGLKPVIIARRPSPVNLRLLLRMNILAITLFGASLLNTPARIAWYAERIPWLDFLKRNESVMLEYGYLYDDPDIGIFRSRLSKEELEQTDRKRAKEASKILDLFHDESTYQEFLKIYTPLSDPFVHEARVHLFSRDRQFERSKEFRDDPKTCAESLTKAFRENQIMEKYFSNTLHKSIYVWSEDKLAHATADFLPDWKFESRVSRSLITQVTEKQIILFFALLIIGLAFLHWYLGRDKAKL